MKRVLAGALLVGILAMPMAVLAVGKGNPTHLKDHPRVNQVNQRVQDQHARIAAGIKNGSISKSEAQQLHQERKSFKEEEHTMRKADGGHLTAADQKALNQQLNDRSKQIYQDKHN